MKLRFTTKTFILSSSLFILFRFLQIILLTESKQKFLKTNFLWLDILLTIICLLPLIYAAANSFYAFRCPNAVGNTGVLGAIFGFISGCLILVPTLKYLFMAPISIPKVILSLLGVIACFLLSASEIFGFEFPKATFLLSLGWSIYQFINAYSVYTGKPLRVRTVYEILALVFSVLFYLNLSKAHCFVKTTKSFRFLYPLGFLAATFCFVSTIPEALAFIFNFKEYITTPSTSSFALFGSGVFITYLTLASNTIKNTTNQ